MTKPWNQAAQQWDNYRAEKPRTMHAPVGPDWPGRAEMLANAQAAHTARQDAEDAARGLLKPANPRGWETAETSVNEMGAGFGVTMEGLALTVADVAKLPVGTRVVVANDWGPLGRGYETSLKTVLPCGSARFEDEAGSLWTLTPECSVRFRLAELAKPEGLSVRIARVEAGCEVLGLDMDELVEK